MTAMLLFANVITLMLANVGTHTRGQIPTVCLVPPNEFLRWTGPYIFIGVTNWCLKCDRSNYSLHPFLYLFVHVNEVCLMETSAGD